ncbi:uncharacterized protein LOC132751354 [Ruditapes philippinarum]|uniref:uncharacterized protein LOC132751354 n=1 Tax=Ruditapes philippinarum TaxID=129788 RepID=UPI00295AFB74|nr:uncharacterized protein LOC132751354 [Ruditapes philippinarum]
MENSRYIIFVLVCVILRIEAVPEYRRVVGHFGDAIRAYEDVMIDEEDELIIATVAKVTSKKVTPSIAFHDFSVGYSVIKLVEKGVCYIEKTRHSMEYLKDILYQAERDNGDYEIRQTFKCTSKTFVEPSEVEMYGERIAAFCKDYESVFVEKDYTMRSKRATQAFEEQSLWCFICKGSCNDNPPPEKTLK